MVLPFDTITQSAEDTQKLGESFGDSLLKGSGSRGETAKVICLRGDLGSGKTTFVQGVARGLAITSRLLSPTFIIVRRYSIPKQMGELYHLDLYRTENGKDAEVIGFSDMINNPTAIVIIEWPERLEGLLPGERTEIDFRVLPDGTHRISGRKYG